jgi:hypothetical protein
MSSNTHGATTAQLDANKALIRSFIDAWNTRDFDRFDDLMGEAATLTVGGATVSCRPTSTRAIAEQ